MSITKLFDFQDRLQISALNHRLNRSQMIHSNIANSETPGYRAIGYDFEEQLQTLSGVNEELPVATSLPQHRKHAFVSADGEVEPFVFVRPTESVGHDGNTVDVDGEMSELAENEILYRTAVETINRKIATLKYAINGGR